MTNRKPTVEYGQLYRGGDVQVFNPDPEIDRIYPMAERVRHGRRNGGKVLRRVVIVLEDWHDVPMSPYELDCAAAGLDPSLGAFGELGAGLAGKPAGELPQ
jgi:hypothetical protein